MRVHLDFETRCELDLKEVGLRRYVSHPSFAILMTALALDEDPVRWYVGLPGLPWRRLADEYHAFNAPFERACLSRCGIDIPVERWRCTMVHAYSRGFSGGLANVGKQIGLPQDKQKLARGSRLIAKFCKPRRPSKDNPDRFWTMETAPDDWEEFREYNRQDVVAEREIARRLSAHPLTEGELDLWYWDQRINANGLPLDVEFVRSAAELDKYYRAQYLDEMKQITGLENPNSRDQLLAWAQERGYPHSDLTAGSIDSFLAEN